MMNHPHRPRYHVLPPSGWLNDPNGLIHWRGEYHMFYQYNPAGAFHRDVHWGHAVSEDLMHWRDLPIALAPTPGTADAGGCWSGCAVDNAGVPTIIYSGHDGTRQLPCLATGDEDLITWQKYPGNPVIAGPPAGLDVVAFRDHCVWKEDSTWYQLVGSGIKGVGGTALLYRSPDLVQWEYMHPLYLGDVTEVAPLWTGSMWECPDFFFLGERHVLVVSVWYGGRIYYPVYFTGTYSNHRFTPEQPHRLDFGTSFYAPQTLRDAQGRRIMWGWLIEQRDDGDQLATGWSGVMSLPRVLSLNSGVLEMRPAPELEMLRRQHYSLQDAPLAEGSPSLPIDVRGDALEIIVEFEPGDATEVGISVRCSPDGSEQTGIIYDALHRRLVLDASRSSLSSTAHLGRYAGPLVLAGGETVRLHIYLDASVVEVFANDRACVTGRIYPSKDDSLGILLSAHSGSARLLSLDVWEMEPMRNA
ncbi:MAG: glycoside hydrolase family 32 protein [Chloroflexia bacterium]